MFWCASWVPPETAPLMWDISDTLNGMMAIPNLIGLLLLSNVIIRSTNDYFKKH